MSRQRCVAVALAVLQLVWLGTARGKEDAIRAAERTFDFTYRVQLTDVAADAQSIKVWLPMPQSGAGQAVHQIRVDGPGAIRIVTEPKYGNQFLYFEIRNGARPPEIRVTYRITRSIRRELHGGERVERIPGVLSPHFLSRSQGLALVCVVPSMGTIDPWIHHSRK